jgi:glycosyltransferase involved in cell wall biosynthesis
MDIIISFPFDPAHVEDRASGNPSTYLRFIKYCSVQNIKSKLYGEKIGKENFIDKNFELIPVFQKQDSWIKFPFKLMTLIPFEKISKYSVIISSHPAYLLPFMILKKDNPIVFESVFEEGCALKATSKAQYYPIKLLYDILEPFILKRSDVIIVSPKYKEYYLKKFPWTSKKLCEMVHESVDLKLFRPINKKEVRKKYGIPESKKIILQIATINKKKRAELLIKAFSIVKSQIPNTLLMFVGPTTDTNHEKFLRELIGELKLTDDIMFMGGNFHYSAIPELINCADVLAISSISETGPLPALESFACGIPIASTDVGLVPLLVKDNKLGRLVPTNVNEMDFAKEIAEILTQEDTEELKIKRRNIAKEFDIETCQSKRLKACELAFCKKYRDK